MTLGGAPQHTKQSKIVLACSIMGLLSATAAPVFLGGPTTHDAARPRSTTVRTDGDGTINAPPARQDQRRYLRTIHRDQTPDVILFDRHGHPLRLPDLLDGDEPVLMQFVFTTSAPGNAMPQKGLLSFVRTRINLVRPSR